MALLAFVFSKVYKEKLISGEKRNTVVEYPLPLSVGQKILVYVSASGSVGENSIAEKIGTAVIEKVIIIKIQHTNQEYVKLMGYKSKKDMIASLKKWYAITKESTITYIEFACVDPAC